jgi:hypothetical protein
MSPLTTRHSLDINQLRGAWFDLVAEMMHQLAQFVAVSTFSRLREVDDITIGEHITGIEHQEQAGVVRWAQEPEANVVGGSPRRQGGAKWSCMKDEERHEHNARVAPRGMLSSKPSTSLK